VGRVKEFGIGFENVDVRRQMGCAQLAEELGYGTYWVPEDYFFRGAFTLASAIACSTRRMRVGLGVVNPYTRHPALTAMEFAALTEIAEGRTVLGIGAGVRHWIETQMCIPYKKPASAMREAADLVRRLFRGESATLEGKVFRTAGAKLSFPSPRAEIPIHLGVLGPQNLEMAGEIADGVLLSGLTSAAYARFALEHVRRGAARAGRSFDDLEIGAFLLISVSDDARAAREAVKPFLATLLAIMSAQPESPLVAAPGMPRDELRRIGEAFGTEGPPVALVSDWMIDTFAVAGSPEHCRRLLAEIVDAGVGRPIAFEVPGVAPETTIRSVHEHLMPHFLA
jgi:5,10-methylenetetrahydromethanopterin reductase